MRTYVLTHLSDAGLLRDLNSIVAHERTTTADVLAHIAEVDTRRLFPLAGFPSMRDYCVGDLHFSENAAYKRIQAARAARDFPTIFPAVADGRLHLAAVRLLAPHLTPENVDGLLTEAAHKSKADVELLMRSLRPPRDRVIHLPRGKWSPTHPVRGNPPCHLPRGKRPHPRRDPFVSDTGQRCGSRKRLEFDHIEMVARGGEATVENVRLRCRAHNQYEAECTLGAGFMSQKRDQAQSAVAGARSRTAAAQEEATAHAAAARQKPRRPRPRLAPVSPRRKRSHRPRLKSTQGISRRV